MIRPAFPLASSYLAVTSTPSAFRLVSYTGGTGLRACNNGWVLTLQSGSFITVETEVKRSRFITDLARTSSEEEARAIVDLAKETYPDARHHCSGFIISSNHVNPLTRSSDDGEPAGTAGRPILDALLHAGLADVTAVVTRYFGGTLLGTGGLVRAYGGAVQAAISAAPLVRVRTYGRYHARVPLAEAGRVEAALRDSGWNIIEVVWGTDVLFDLALADGDAPRIEGELAALLQQSARVHKVGTFPVEIDIAGEAP